MHFYTQNTKKHLVNNLIFKKIWRATAPDCRLKLVVEALLCPADYHRREQEEIKFQLAMRGRWKK